jgi:hypothetical protein
MMAVAFEPCEVMPMTKVIAVLVLAITAIAVWRRDKLKDDAQKIRDVGSQQAANASAKIKSLRDKSSDAVEDAVDDGTTKVEGLSEAATDATAKAQDAVTDAVGAVSAKS